MNANAISNLVKKADFDCFCMLLVLANDIIYFFNTDEVEIPLT